MSTEYLMLVKLRKGESMSTTKGPQDPEQW